MIRRTQAERSDETTGRLVSAARERFGATGYALTSIDAVAAAAGVTKGAAYHHFGGKAELFRAAFVAELEAVDAKLLGIAAEEADVWAALRRGCRTFLEHCLDPGFRQIVLLDAPAVLGWETVREIEHDHMLRILRDGLLMAVATGQAPDGDLDARAQLMFGALCEGGMLLARSKEPAADLPGIAAEADRLLSALVAPPQ
ncbi:TetR/AcrR family transcriptional regulator [Nonomuraea gerenzanensis]|uniref:Transcriptional regulator, TetR family n=1 Tax=Nonomuraea gerenzanensis TaxID=93944 RepID=A0A1M4E524_9ACTN|nr:TetR/AcrR family transcriptional regulator [Nonomuraea gerenzanensis]UBU16087.1 TetR family transcriptional regulator [Nonomuraea gerenzanensis]SBO93890.1 Transcriptional regulator, TetR family [Nonomuraea gerenzanensis]